MGTPLITRYNTLIHYFHCAKHPITKTFLFREAKPTNIITQLVRKIYKLKTNSKYDDQRI